MIEPIGEFSGTDAQAIRNLGIAAHIGGVSACVHHGFSSALPPFLAVYTSKDFKTTVEAEAAAYDPDLPLVLRLSDDDILGPGIEAFECQGHTVWASDEYRAVVEALLEDEYLDDDGKREIVESFLARDDMWDQMLLSVADAMGATALVQAWLDRVKH